MAVIGGHLSCVKMLVAAGAEVDQPDGTSGRTPLHHAVEADNVAIAGHLLLEVIITITQCTDHFVVLGSVHIERLTLQVT